MGKINKIIIPGVVIGFILALSQPLFNWSILVFAGLVLFFLAIKIIQINVHSFWLGLTAGLVYFLIYFRWYWTVYPLTHLGIDRHLTAFWFVLLVWILTAVPLALTWGASARLWKALDSKVSWPALLIFPSVFTVFEYLRSYLIGLVWIGQATPVGPNWTNGNLAYNLHKSFLALKLASWLGIYGVTFVIIFLSVLLFILGEKRKYKKLFVLAVAIIVLVYFPAINNRPARLNLDGEDKVVAVAAIQTKVPSQVSYTPAEEASIFKEQLMLIDSVSKNFPKTGLVVFPEESNFFKTLTLFRNNFGASQYFYRLFPSPALIVDNSKIITGSQWQSKTIFLDSQKGVLGSYDKLLITPGGEYVPLIFRALDKLLGLNSPAIQTTTEYQAGQKPPEVVSGPGDLKATSLICSDIFSPILVPKEANVLMAQSSFSFAKGAPDLLGQDLAAGQFRAAESSRYLVKSSNFGHAYIISNQGQLEKITPNLDSQILTGTVVLKNGKTLYNKIGDSPILLASLGVLIVSLFLKKYANN